MASTDYTTRAATRGIAFDLHRFALKDGPGIRTTVFLKGCPLSCLWCHNPESQNFRLQLSFDPDRCTHCLACVDVCDRGALVAVDGRLQVDRALCDGCGACPAACPEDALSVIGFETTVADIIEQVVRDRAYFERSGGGLTVSGGEPLSQPDFTAALMAEAKSRGLHTCLDTSGAVHPRKLQSVMPYVDLFLFDYKETDPWAHRDMTGVSNDLILKNLEYLYEKEADIILRCPLVPGVNDSPRHMQAIAELDRRYPDLRGIEIMAYHDMGRSKAIHVGMPAPLAGLPSADQTTKEGWLTTLHGLGCLKASHG